MAEAVKKKKEQTEVTFCFAFFPLDATLSVVCFHCLVLQPLDAQCYSFSDDIIQHVLILADTCDLSDIILCPDGEQGPNVLV